MGFLGPAIFGGIGQGVQQGTSGAIDLYLKNQALGVQRGQAEAQQAYYQSKTNQKANIAKASDQFVKMYLGMQGGGLNMRAQPVGAPAPAPRPGYPGNLNASLPQARPMHQFAMPDDEVSPMALVQR